MSLGPAKLDESETALIQFCKLVSDRLLAGGSFVDGGFHLEFHGGAGDFEQKVVAAVSQAIEEIPREQFFAILMSKVRNEMRRDGEAVLTDNELPPGFSSN